MSDVTQILNAIEEGDPQAAEKLLPLVYEELRKLARHRMAQESPDHTLQATALVHDAYLRLVDVDKAQHWNSRGHFFGAAAEAMRRILVEDARRKARLRHGGEWQRIDIDQISLEKGIDSLEILDLDEALKRLEDKEPQTAELVQLRYFAGLTIKQTSEVMEISVRAANRHWRFARAWLFQQLEVFDDA